MIAALAAHPDWRVVLFLFLGGTGTHGAGAIGLAAQTDQATRTADAGCVLCHGELELLRQHVPTLGEARALLVPPDLASSAHDTMSCGSCHGGFGTFPHAEAGRATEDCASCHQDVHDLWRGSVHATEDEVAACADCHGVHDALPVAELSEGGGMRALNARCVACHTTSFLPPSDPHRDSIPCTGCHTPHETAPVDGPASSVAPLTQRETCGACHQEVADSSALDVHGRGLDERRPASLAALVHDGAEAPATCTSCHGAHGMLAPSHERFDQDMVAQCQTCHGEYARTYFGTYHGKATAVGSEIVATCDHCHGAHQIFPEDDARSMVAPERLVETCGACHENARPAFVEYVSHPEPMNREKNPPLFYSFVFMNTLLFGVLGVFTLHTALWWVRLMIDRRKGVVHGPGGRT